ncbi:hypothetical protein JCM11491_003101 [Sporobolomyces phaffii]
MPRNHGTWDTPTPPVTYEQLRKQINAVVDKWGNDTLIDPGWTPREWADDFLTKISPEVWTSQKASHQALIVESLENENLSPDIHSTYFPTDAYLQQLCGLGTRTGSSHSRDYHNQISGSFVPAPSHTSALGLSCLSSACVPRTILKPRLPLAIVGVVPANPLDTRERVRLAIGRIALAYTFGSQRVDAADSIDPGWAAFNSLGWLIPNRRTVREFPPLSTALLRGSCGTFSNARPVELCLACRNS